jgi:hypothetical protein
MPVYVYRRRDGSTFEIEQRITEAEIPAATVVRMPRTQTWELAGKG